MSKVILNNPDIAPNGMKAQSLPANIEEGGYVWRLGMWWRVAEVFNDHIGTIDINTSTGNRRRLWPEDYEMYAPPRNTNRDLAHMQRAAGELRDFPELRAERVANHYVRLSLLAQDMRRAIELRKVCPSKELDDFIETILKTINDQHKVDFGKGLWEE